MFAHLSLVYVFGPAMTIASILLFFYDRKINKQSISILEKAIRHFKFTPIVFGSLVLILCLLLPVIASLSTFGYLTEISNVNNEAKILHYFQEYNTAIVRTTDVVKWFLFLFMWWFLSSLYLLVTALKGNTIKTIA